MRRTTLCFIISLVAVLCYGQTAAVSGRVLDVETEQPLPGAVITLTNQASAKSYTAVSNASGVYAVSPVPYGNYKLEANMISYEPFEVLLIQLTPRAPHYNMNMELTPNSAVSVEEVVITAKPPPVRTENGLQIYDVQATPSLKTASLGDVLDIIPSISADPMDGKLEMRGGGATLLINGKPINRAPAAVMRSLQASQIKEVQVNTSPSAKYAAEGSAGIINVVLVKNTKRGFNGDVDVSGGNIIQSGYIGLNYNNSKVNLSLEPFFRTINADFGRNRRSAFPNGLIQENNFEGKYKYHYYDITAGLDVYLDSTSTVFFSANVYTEGNDDSVDGIYDSFGTQSASTGFDTQLDYDVPGYILDLNYQKDFPQEGRNLLLGLLYEFYTDKEDYLYAFTDNFSRTTERRSIENGGDDFLYQANLDYTHPLKSDLTLDVGAQFFLNTGNDFSRFFDWQGQTGPVVEQPQMFNEYEEHNQVNSAYLSATREWNKFSGHAGIRAEQTILKLDLTQQAMMTELDRDYTNLFPSLKFSYQLSPKNDLNLSYSRRITRPDGLDLNPFVNELDTSRLWAGNPNLQPEFINGFELGFVHSGNTTNFSIINYYRSVQDLIRMTTNLNAENVTLFKPDNFGNSRTMGTDVSFSTSPTNWWDFRVGGNLNRILFDEDLTEIVNTDISQFRVTYSNDFYLPAGLSLTASGRYTAPQDTYQGHIDESSAIHFSLDKELFEGDGGVAVIARNIFNSDDKWVDLLTADGVQMNDLFYDRDRIMSLNFYYSFGNAVKKRRKQERDWEEDRGNGEDIREN